MPSETASAMETTSSAPFLVDDVGNRRDVFDHAEEVRRLDEHSGGFVVHRLIERFQIDAAILAIADGRQRHSLMTRVGGDDFAIFRMHAGSDHRLVASGDANGHHQAFGGAGRTVIHGGVRDIHAGQFADHRLKLEDRLQRALGDFRLIRSIGGEELAARYERVDHHRPVVGVSSSAQESRIALAVFGGTVAEEFDDFALRIGARNVEVTE